MQLLSRKIFGRLARHWLVTAVASGLFLSAASAPDQTPDLTATAAQLRDKALIDPMAYALVESLTTEIGPRLAGSPNAERARDWGLAKLRSLGFENVHAEAFPITAIVRGAESAEVTTPFRQQLAVVGLGGTVPTPTGGVEAEIALFHTYAELLAAPVGSLNGRIAVVTEAQPRSREGTGYGQLSPNRRRGPAEAARRGAIAYLTRSLATNDARLPHTGALNYDAAVPRIPAGAISVPDAVLLDNMAARGQPIRIRLVIETTTAPGLAWNVVGDLPGDGSSQEIIVIGGHLDSWDAGTGAIDDGAGIAITTAAARLAASAPGRKRTLRVVMFGAEEMDYASEAWGKAHQPEFARFALTSESDNGADNIWALRLPAGALERAEFKALPDLLRPLKIEVLPDPATGSGDDTRSMTAAGVPAFAFRQDASRYFDIHHSADDTLDKIDRVQLNQNVAAWATVLYLAASSSQDFRAQAR